MSRKKLLAPSFFIEKDAIMDETYRFLLWQTWDTSKLKIAFIGLNPSTADHEKSDPTLDRLINYAYRWGYGSTYIVNLFAYKAPHPGEMIKAPDPKGKDNDEYIDKIAKTANFFVAVWGDYGIFKGRDREVIEIFEKNDCKIHCIKISKKKCPRHPMSRLEADLLPIEYV